MKKLFAIFAVAGLLTACNNDEKAATDAAAKATADSLEKVRIEDSIKAATPAVTDTTKSTMEKLIDTGKAKLEGAANKTMDAAKEGIKQEAGKVMDKVKEEVKK